MRSILKLVVALVLGGAIFYALVVALNPWALHMGGVSTPLLYWTGTGTLLAKDGKSYPLYVYLHPGRSASHLHRDGLKPNAGLGGSAELCTAPGTTELLKLSGTMYGGYRTTEGSLMDFRLLEWKVVDPQMKKGYFDLAGYWHGGTLAMTLPNSQGRTFLTGVHIEGATVTLQAASHDAFATACREWPSR
jgi:hypothetical protein